MRISTNQFFNTNTSSMLDLQSSVAKLQQQATNGRVLTPADDPVASARALDLSQSQAVNTQLQTNRNNANTQLTQTESIIGNVVDLISEIKSQAISAGNGGFTDHDRADIATALRANFDQMLGYANTTDGLGNYLFSGFKSSTQPFVDNPGTGVAYQGDQGVQTLQVDTGRTMNVSVSGQALFQGPGGDIFKTLNDLVTILNTPISPAANAIEGAASKVVFDNAFGLVITGNALPPAPPPSPLPTPAQIAAATAAATPQQIAAANTAAKKVQDAHDSDYTRTDFTPGSTGALNQALAKAGKAIDKSIDNVVTVRASVGSNMKELDTLDLAGSAKDLQFTSTIADLMGQGPNDFAKTLSELTQQQTLLQAAQKTFAVTSSLSLLNFIR